jgi:ATP-dependent helicase/nuclease subunit B
MSRSDRRVYSIPAGVGFLDALAEAVLCETAGDPLTLASYRILLPTRRACRSLQESFLRLADGKPLLLPRLEPLGDIDAEELLFAGASDESDFGDTSLALPPAVAPLRRQLLLSRAILAARHNFAGRSFTLDQAARLAAELQRLLDQMTTERVGFDKLHGLAGEHAEHWQHTLNFLEVLSKAWPEMLAIEQALDPADRRNRLLAAEAERLARDPPASPLIAAGSTGSIPATADLLAVIAALPQGRVVLPGLDRHWDAETWAAIEEDPFHPQHGMAQLLRRIGLRPDEVEDWPSKLVPEAPPSRARLLAEALRPAETTESWRGFASTTDRERLTLSLREVERVDCPTPEEEARVIALRLRAALELPGKRAALITPDRALARRVAAELRRWEIEIDDSAGRPLALTPPAVFLRLVAEMVDQRAAPAALLALLKHPLAALGREPAQCRRLARQLDERLRGPRPQPGLGRLARLGRLDKELRDFLADLHGAAAPFVDLVRRRKANATDLLQAHVQLAEALAASDAEKGPDRLWAGEAGEALAGFVAELQEAMADLPPMDGRRWIAFLDALLAGRVVRPRYGRHPRLAIWGPLEARLQQADLVILGGLNEGTWPPQAPIDPWFSRPMRRALGLSSLDRRIGQAAHDFVQAAASAPALMLTRSLRVEGAPSVASRWLLRLDGLLRLVGIAPQSPHAGEWLGWQKTIDEAEGFAPAAAPTPRPPVALRPSELSVTEIETWMRDPYAIYARRILMLEPLDPLDADPGAAERGSFIHEALENFVKAYPEGLPADAYDNLIACGREAFGHSLDWPTVRAFWWPRFERIARWFLAEETLRRPLLAASLAEARGRFALELPGCRPFTLKGKADRIDRLKSGGLVIIDYKTGRVPSSAQVEALHAPQLPLEAAMVAAGAFAGLEKLPVAELAYWSLKGGRDVAEIIPIKGDPVPLGARARQQLAKLIAAYEDPSMPYLPAPDPDFAPGEGPYDQLSRRGEWGVDRGEGAP